jgi:hypothetical protein
MHHAPKMQENQDLRTHQPYQKSLTLIPISLSLRAANLAARCLKTVTWKNKKQLLY